MQKPPTFRSSRILTSSIAALSCLATLSPSETHADSGSWFSNAAGNWSAAANWNPAAVPGTVAGDVVSLTNDITAARTVTIDNTSRRVGDLNIGDPGATLFGFTLAASGGAVLFLDGAGTTDATVDFTASIGNTISTPLSLVDNAIFRSNVNAVQTVSGVISGVGKTVTFNNDTEGTTNAATPLFGQFTLSGANTFSGGTTISDVRVSFSNNRSFGLGAVTIQNGGQAFVNSALTGVANTFVIAGDGWAETAAGQPFGALRIEGGATISGNVRLSDNAAIGGNSAAANVISGIVSGGFTLSKRGTGNITLSGTNTYTGGTAINNGSLILASNNAAGTGAITINSGGATTPTRLFVSGGVTISNPITIADNTFNVAGNGALQQTGTGQARINSAITINGTPAAGGHFMGGLTAGNELVLGGTISSAVPNLIHRDGRVVYAVGGSGGSWATLSITGTALIGATNGIPTNVVPTIGTSQTGIIDLNGFNQAFNALVFGAGGGGTTFAGNVSLGARTLTMNGDITNQVAAITTQVTHSITGSAGGTVAFGDTPRSINLTDNPATLDELLISGATITGTGGVSKSGDGTLGLSGVTLATPFTVAAGTLRTGTVSSAGAFTANSLTFATGTTLLMKTGAGGDLVTSPALVNAGTTNVVLHQIGGALGNGTYNLINYAGGTSPGLAGFALAPLGHATASLIDTGTSIALSVTANDRVIWDGTNTSAWATGVTGNWKLGSTLAVTDYIQNDDVIFQDGATNPTADIATNVTPSAVAFTNTTSTAISITGAAGIIGSTEVSKTGDGILNLGGVHRYVGATALSAGTTNLTGSLSGSNVTVGAGATLVAPGTIAGAGVTLTSDGTVTLQPTAANTFTGATTINAGSLTANYTTAAALAAASPISIASGATLQLQHAGGVFALSNPISGAGTVIVDPGVTTVGNRDIATVNWNTTGFTGTLRLAPTTGTMRIAVDNPADLGGATVEVAAGGQIFVSAGNQTFANNITISGTGYSEGAGFLGAIRANNPTTFTGAITVSGAAKIGALGGTVIITNTISGGTLTFGGSNNNTSEALAITGNASGLTGLVVNDGLATGNANTIAVNVGNNTASGTIGAVPVSLLADGFKNSVIRFDRTDGYTLGAPVTSISAAANHIRTFVDADSQGTGFSDNGLAINLGGTLSTTGGQFRVGQNRTNSVAHITGALTAGIFAVGANQIGAIANLNSGAVVNVGTTRVGFGGAVNGNSTLNLNNGSSLTAFNVGLGEVANGIGIVNQAAGSTVNIDAQLRVGHFATNTSVYNMAGGTLTMTGASPNLTPSTAGGGGANATGDNNINALATPILVGGGIYLGNDGTGIMNHSGGTVTTNWLVLDNRGATGAGGNMPDGLDRYNMSGSAVLKLRSTWGFIGRAEGSYAVSFGGGTIQVDNTGTGTGTGLNINIPLDATIDTVTSTTTTLDTVLATNAFTLTKDIRGTGTLGVAGGGAINFSTTGTQTISAAISGSNPLTKIGTGTTTLSGASSGYTGVITVSGGRLNMNGAVGAAATVIVADGTVFSSEQALNSLTLGTTAGSTLLFDPTTNAKLTVNALNAVSNTLIDLSGVLPGDGSYPVLSFLAKTGTGTFSLVGGANYRSAVLNESATALDLIIANTKSLIWNGIGGTTWDLNLTSNWEDSANPGTQEKFFHADVVTFGDTDANGNIIIPPTTVTVTAGVAPVLVQVNGTLNNYTLSSTGAGIAGGEIFKDGSTTLTLIGANTYPGKTTVAAGTVSIADPASLGNGAPGNSIALSNGGRLAYTGTVATNLGTNRDISVGSGGGTLSHSGTAAAAITIPGKLIGANLLTLSSTAAGAGTFTLTGNNSGFSGTIVLDAQSTGLTTLTIPNQAALPAASSITLNFPAAGANGNTTTLNLLGGVVLPVTTTLNMTSFHNGTISLRSQVTTTGNVVINSPITLTGSSIIQMNPPGGSTLTLNGPITAGPGGFAGPNAVFFIRGAGSGVLNSTVNLPGATVSHTDAGPWIINSTGNVWAFTGILSSGVVSLGAHDALPTGAILSIGQNSDAANSLLEMNGFNQEVNGLTWIGGNGSSLRGVGNSSTTLATLTLNSATDYTFGSTTGNSGGNLTGNLALVKNGTNTQTLAGPANTYTGNVTINAGTLVASGNDFSTALGNPTIAGRTVTVNNAGSTLSLTATNVFGTGAGNNNLPVITLNLGTTLTSTRYNVLGALTLNGATLAQSSTDSGTREGFQLLGGVTVGGTIQSLIESANGKANHLGANTVFNVADAIAGVDLLVTAPLSDQSADFSSSAGGFTKTGPGSIELVATNPYTGATLVDAGLLRVTGSISGSALTVNGPTAALDGSGTVGPTTVLNGGSVSAGVTTGVLSTVGNFSMTTGTSLVSEINGITPGSGYDQINVAGTVSLGNATLALAGSYTGFFDIFTLIVNDGAADPVVGTFAGLPEGSPIIAAGTGQQFTISYVGGDGNDVILTAIPEPGSAAMLLGGAGLLLGVRRRRRTA